MAERARGPIASTARSERRVALALCAPALLVLASIALFPLGYTFWESLHLHDLAMPWRGRPFIGLQNYAQALRDARFLQAVLHTLFFAAVSVSLELLLGLGLALLLHRSFAGRGLARTLALLPWSIPTVVAALMWRFLFEQGPLGAAGAFGADGSDFRPADFASHARLAWLPIITADVWKTTPFVALLLLSGLSSIDTELYEAARIDGAGPWALLWHVTLPGLRPALSVALVFRSLDALRVFDLVYVLTGGGPGTATEPLALYSFQTLLHDLRFGYGSALSMLVFAMTGLLCFLYLRASGTALFGDPR